MLKLKKGKLMACLLCTVMSVCTFTTTGVVEAKKAPADNGVVTVMSKNFITGEESKTTYSDCIGGSDKTSGFSEAYIPDAVAPKINKSIIGSDDRFRVKDTTTFPYSAIAQVDMEFPNGKRYIGSAWMYGPNVALTAGHCLYSGEDGGWPSSIVIYPGRNGHNKPFGSYSAKAIYLPEKFAMNRNTNYDWGIIELKEDIGNTTGYFGAFWKGDTLNDTDVDITGYPGEKHRQMWKMNGVITKTFPHKINYSIDTTGGQSGCPVYLSDGSYRSVAVHTNGGYSYNKATRITKGIFDFIQSFR